MSTIKAWDFEGYWGAVVGPYRTPSSVVEECGFEDVGAIRLWLDAAEAEAIAAGGIERPESWDAHNARAFGVLAAVV